MNQFVDLNLENRLDVLKFLKAHKFPKNRNSLKDKDQMDLFLKLYSLTPDSLFNPLVISILKLFKIIKILDPSIVNLYDSWLNLNPRKLKKSTKKLKIHFNSNIKDSFETNESIFCLETAYTILIWFILLHVIDDFKIYSWSIFNKIEEKLYNSSADSELFPIICLNIIKNVLDIYEKTHFESIFREETYSWWKKEISIENHVIEEIKCEFNIDKALKEFSIIITKTFLLLYKFDFSEMHGDLFGDLYQKYFDKKLRKSLGEFYTPMEVVKYILDNIGYSGEHILERRLIDLSCGSGTFILEALKRYLYFFKKEEKKHDKISKWANKLEILCNEYQIVGIDIHPFACQMAKIQYLMILLPYYKIAIQDDPNFKLKNIPIFRADSIYSHISDNKGKGNSRLSIVLHELKYSYVVGNPPYINIRMIDKKKKEKYGEIYSSAKGLYDLYCLFIEKGIKLLQTDGKLGFLTSNQFLLSDYGRSLRTFLLKNGKEGFTLINQILDFRDTGMFKDAINYPCIILLTKTEYFKDIEKNKIKCLRMYKPYNLFFRNIQKNISREISKENFYDLFEYPQLELTENLWTLMPQDEMEVFKQIQDSKTNNFEEIAENIFVGTQTSLDKVYLCHIEEDHESGIVKVKPKNKQNLLYNIEKKILKPVLKGKDVSKWNLTWSNHWLIFPYNNEDKSKVLSQDEIKKYYPKAWEYFLANELSIKNRERKRMDERDDWYAYIYPKNHNKFEQPKIISQLLSKKNRFSLDKEGRYYFIAVGGNCITLYEKYRNMKYYMYSLGLLNSAVFEFFLKHISPVHDGGFYLFIKQYLKRFPYIEYYQNEEISIKIVKKVEKIIEIKKNTKNNRIIEEIVKKIEKEIDILVYRLFNLNEKQKKVIERFNARF